MPNTQIEIANVTNAINAKMEYVCMDGVKRKGYTLNAYLSGLSANATAGMANGSPLAQALREATENAEYVNPSTIMQIDVAKVAIK